MLSTSSFNSSESSRRLRSSSKTPRESSYSPTLIPSGSSNSRENRSRRSKPTQSSRKRGVSKSTDSSCAAKTRSKRNFNYTRSGSMDRLIHLVNDKHNFFGFFIKFFLYRDFSIHGILNLSFGSLFNV